MSNAYADVGAFVRMQIANAPNVSAGDAIEIIRLLNAASRSMDEESNRYFYSVSKSLYLNGNGWRTLDLPDTISLSSVAIDQARDGSFSTVLAGDGISNTADFYLLDADRDDPYEGAPYRMIRLNANGSLGAFPRGFRLVKLTGVYGYSADTLAVLTTAGAQVNGTLASASATALTLSATPDYPIMPGATLVLGSEQVYVATGSGTAFVVERGLNGTTAATHSAVAASRVAYPDVVVQATIMQVARLWARRQTPMYPHFIMQGPGAGVEKLSLGLDPDIAQMLLAVRNYRDLS